MDKQSYKEILAETMVELSEAKNEITRLQILVVTYQDKENELKKLVYDNPNDFKLGGIVRSMYFEKDKKSRT